MSVETTADRHQFNWLLGNFVHQTDGVRDAVAVSSDGLLIAGSDGLSRAETAVRLHLSPNTVRTHVQSILTKLEVNSSVAAVTLAARAGDGDCAEALRAVFAHAAVLRELVAEHELALRARGWRIQQSDRSVEGGARRDEEASRAKERIFSHRNTSHAWDPRNQRPEPWNLFNTQIRAGESMRVFPLSNWTELDVWLYIEAEGIPVVPLYFARERPVVQRDDHLIMVDDDRLPLYPAETPSYR